MEIQRADPGARRRAALILVVAAAAGAILLVLLDHWHPHAARWLDKGPAARSRAAAVLAALVVLLVSPLLVFGVYLCWLGRRIVRAGRFPLPSTRVYRDTAVLSGRAAEARGRLIQSLGVVLAALALAAAGLFWRFAPRLLGLAAS